MSRRWYQRTDRFEKVDAVGEHELDLGIRLHVSRESGPAGADDALDRLCANYLDNVRAYTTREMVQGADGVLRPWEPNAPQTYKGEIVGIAGISGNGQQELLAALSGEHPLHSEQAFEVQLDGESVGDGQAGEATRALQAGLRRATT